MGAQCRVGGAVGIAVAVVVVVVVVVVCNGNCDEATTMVVLLILFFLCCFLRRFNFALSSCRSSFRSPFFSGTLLLVVRVVDVEERFLRPRSRRIGRVLFLDELWSGYCCCCSACTNILLVGVVGCGC